MMTHKKRFLIIILTALVIVIIFSFMQHSSRTVYNDENETGNTPGNLFNGGLFCELNGTIYFSNSKDDGTLYQMDIEGKNFKKLYTDKATYINALGKYLYYVRSNNTKQTPSDNLFTFSNVGVYRINLNGSKLKLLYEDPSGLINVYGNTVYYQHYREEEGLTFNSVGIDALNDKLLSNESILPLSFVGDTLFYTGTLDDHNIKTMNIRTGQSSILYEENCYAPIVNNNYIFYMSLTDNYSIYRINMDGSNPTPIVAERCSTYNITLDGKYLYYQVDDNTNNRICIMNLQTGESNTILDGNYKQIHLTSNYVFFNDFSDTSTYYMPIGSTESINNFSPPNLSE